MKVSHWLLHLILAKRAFELGYKHQSEELFERGLRAAVRANAHSAMLPSTETSSSDFANNSGGPAAST